MELDDFFGLDFNIKKFEINILLDLLSIRRKIENIETVKNITERFGAKSPFLMVSKRQQTLKFLKNLIAAEFMSFDRYYYEKEVNTASEHDRRYNAEDRVLEFALMVASGKTLSQLKSEEFRPGIRSLRELSSADRFDRLWEVLAEQEKSNIDEFKKALAKG